MSVHLQRAIEQLKKDLLALFGLVEDQVQIAVRALIDRDEEMACEVERRDGVIDDREVQLEEECLKILALHQPVAGDLRFIVSSLKIDNDLERIGDLAVNIARKAKNFANMPAMVIPFDLDAMWETTQSMLRDSLTALVNLNPDLANDVCSRDDAVDQFKRTIRLKAEQMIREDPERITAMLVLLGVSRNLERIADHATNIAEDVVYMIQGVIIRHAEGE
jgi:phosphate transport system protein